MRRANEVQDRKAQRMTETPKQYTTRLLALLGNRDAIAVMASTASKLEKLLRKIPRRTLARRPQPKKWSVAEIVAHLAEVEIVLAYRMRMILSDNGTVIQAMDQDKWVKNSGYLIKDSKKAVELFRVLRQSNLAMLKSISKKHWRYYGIHAERGEESIAHIVRMYAGHDLNHLMQIERTVKG